jgi:hypothetical protein
VFVADDRFARTLYRDLGGNGNLVDALEGKPLLAMDASKARSATVLSANGAAPARLTLARFHAPQTCGSPGLVTELVLAFPPGGAGGRTTPPSHVTVVALLDGPPFAGGAGRSARVLLPAESRALVRHAAERAENATRGTSLGLLHVPAVDADQAADAGEVIPVGSRYAVGFRATFAASVAENRIDTTLISGVATTDLDLHEVRWVVRPRRMRLHGGMIAQGVRYSLRGRVGGGPGGGALLVIDEIADVSPRDSRATVVDPETRRVVAAQPLALRCP